MTHHLPCPTQAHPGYLPILNTRLLPLWVGLGDGAVSRQHLAMTFSCIYSHAKIRSCILCASDEKWKRFRPWLVWLSGLNAGLRTKESPVQFLVSAHAWAAGQVPNGGHKKQPHIDISLPLFKKKKNNKQGKRFNVQGCIYSDLHSLEHSRYLYNMPFSLLYHYILLWHCFNGYSVNL